MHHSTAENLSIIVLSIVVSVSLFVSSLYAIRVIRKSNDHLKWALLGVLASLALTNSPLLLWYLGYPLPLWVGQVARLFAAIVLTWAVWPLICDSWFELKARCKLRKATNEAVHHYEDDEQP